MNNRILIVYASRSGSTQGVAEALGKHLASDTVTVDVRHVKDVSDLSPYRAVVVGSAINGGRWLPEAANFVRIHQTELNRIPTAFFLICMMMAKDTERNRNFVSTYLEPARAMVRPVAEGRFAGVLWPKKYPLMARLGLRIFSTYLGFPEGDYRNWDAIRDWANYVRPLLLK